ncbi:MAG: hypothetical protein HY789_07875 [Deltaproteobacteria bacterium]|nr:hypothetical protein [Deltaproteobacteria bacterium]
MKNRKLIWQIFPPNLLITLAAMLAVSWYGSNALQKFYLEQLGSALQTHAYLIKDRVSELAAADRIKELREFCRQSGREISTRITVIDGSGRVPSGKTAKKPSLSALSVQPVSHMAVLAVPPPP